MESFLVGEEDPNSIVFDESSTTGCSTENEFLGVTSGLLPEKVLF